ncbi:hypothetical protein A2334_04035 [Candidatus Roizmanbacteria bacterium RIFOXYB2_FULL_38_10]|uniref:Uncharacterized protein n=1 Tax=Candidatus Roizmanbacteria bacterium RIFOXYD1_FULL_38_12 TaxID=1802093 RepID=A0A1F7KZ88_9BACT|nr:MAG: hypothetical protein A3K47_00145 [Candidatus Roizmanbacteria bacterium RIFOXYA2_FULL_38_14]OGK63212.1 MAG: hypothetical protein A3K27_00145 [Candidatus Roizmanbacteria bacterium RIFOXYA1_FULL_37_12]OGK65058.1 MAG: hypothetical protein A3K38_00145 [Candidatus Roizmanbacteria bacterium RIFOXYB1_FULL_40_23]OGK68613.1 MAG: hypothetical protein A2334_04035 [Candidatus Roizmanbacteria bacterium RIFOXYB2_FULL_38_10]OGK69461.1 MAG: hypothetical protein A3K21_00145 [Candidatus Roizmanbacteria ba
MKHFFVHFTKEFNKHIFDYLLLSTIGVIFLILLKVNQGNKTYSFVTALAFCIFYILWGIYHHFKLGSLYLINVVEYILIGFTFLFLLKIILVI